VSTDNLPLKICFVITGLNVGGAQIMLIKLLESLNRARFLPSVVCLGVEGPLASRIRNLGIEVFCLDVPEGRWSLSGLIKLVKRLKQLKPQLLQGWMYHGNLAAQIATLAGFLRIPVIWNIRGSHTELTKEQFSTAIAIVVCGPLSYLARTVINNSSVSMRLHIKRLRYSQSNVAIIPNGFDTEQFKPSPMARRLLMSRVGLTSEKKLIGHIARLHPMKDHMTLLRAAALLLRDRRDVHFVLIGEGVDASSRLSELADTLGIAEHVHMLGQQEIPNLIPGFDLVTLTSAFGEGFPNVIGEAMASGVPCVVTDVGDCAYLVDDTGEVVLPKDVLALADRWRHILDLPESELLQLRKRARARMVEHFSLGAVVAQYEGLYAAAAKIES
jgi:glycosyltransferase involved in cell wall biosynthesis